MSATDLYRRIAQLEQQVASLQKQPSGSEALQPTYLTAAPDGSIGAVFPGGIQLPELSGAQLVTQKALTIADAQNIGRAVLYGWAGGLPVVHTVALASNADASDLPVGGTLIDMAAIVCESEAGTGGSVSAAAQNNTQLGDTSVTVITDLGQSSFLQLAGTARKLQLALGSGTLTWGAAGNGSSILTVTHNIGRVPSIVIANAVGLSDGSGQSAWVGVGGLSSTQAQLVGDSYISHALGTTATVYWLAIG